ncbi:DUF4956 domain-containing protein [Anaerosacchariphilus polymeriproducens]|uniref:DUF4956 domain-containing protein n=1 Tax=Anaerosacchariphilus polymeriproducens TaxID=1812858 RepID=A0A371AWL5_9FIRM|nr:DUF4956 domain-containing protein [Anaerosacchariphilus polymeriproducens]RDU23968.1 DUF4956 domain-containing protein [Anaerosacchariphilus polymeriproducens]
MTFNDIFKSSFLKNAGSVSIVDMVLAMVLAFAIGMLIFFVYKKTNSGLMYSSSFGVTLVALTMISTFVILAVTSNVVLSLGMVGALSIVRFRTAIKEPMDIAFLFWSIAAGIVLAAGLIPLAVFGSVLIAIMLFVFVNKNTYDNPYIAVIYCENQEAEKVMDTFLGKNVKKKIIKSKTVTKDNIELNYEIRLKGDDTSFINQLADISGVKNAILVSYNGEYMG